MAEFYQIIAIDYVFEETSSILRKILTFHVPELARGQELNVISICSTGIVLKLF